MDLLYAPFILLIAVPPLAIVPTLFFGTCRRRFRPGYTRWGAACVTAGAVSWFAYTLYECAVWVWSQGVTAPIRIDLLVIAPVLYVVSTLGLVACWRARLARRKEPSEDR